MAGFTTTSSIEYKRANDGIAMNIGMILGNMIGGGSSSQTHEIGDVYHTAEELHQLHLDEKALRETLEEQTMDENALEEKIRQKQADDDESFMEFGMMRIDSDYVSSD
ncbi:hypothetical protein Tco_0689456 [Tanacetum coccineum]